MGKKSIAVFLSGRGSNFRAIFDAVEEGKVNGYIEVVVSDNPDAKGLSFARANGIRSAVFEKSRTENRTEYFDKIIEFLDGSKIDLIVLAGFMKVLSGRFIEKYRNRILNIHPALLPSFPGEHAQRQALDYGVKYSGCTVHFVDEGVDTGPIVLQEAVPVQEDDTEDSLSARILEQEHKIYPRALQLFCEERLKVEGRRVLILNH
jgi:phosphoribosylglycinamide formyltransferase-1